MRNTKIKKRTFIGIIMLVLLIGFVVYTLLSRTENNNTKINYTIIVLSFFNIIIPVIGLINEAKKRSFSFSMMFWIFNFVFFGISPIIQYISGWHSWKIYYTDEEYIICQLLVLLWMLSFVIGIKSVYRIKIKANIEKDNKPIIIINNHIAIIIQLLIVAYLAFTLGGSLFYKSDSANITIANSALSLLNHHFFRNLIYYLTVIQILKYFNKRNNFLLVIISIVLMFIGCFPLGLNRYMVGAFYLGIMIIILGKDKLRIWFPFIMLFSIMVIFPIINMFRFATSLPDLNTFVQNVQIIMKGTYNTGNYDAFHMLLASVQYAKNEGFSYGYQMLGAILFFIPRSIWPNKPIGTGAKVIVGLKGTTFSNVCMPLVGESFYNFGILGVIIFGFIIGWFCEHFDQNYWHEKNTINTKKTVMYPSAILFFFFLNRGDLMSSGSYMIANIVVGLITLHFFSREVQRK